MRKRPVLPRRMLVSRWIKVTVLVGWHKHERRVGDAALTGTPAILLAVLALVCVVGCGTSTKRSDSETPVPSSTGLIVINPQFDEAGPFIDGLASVRIGNFDTGKYGFVDKQGKYVVNPQFSSAEQFSEGLASVRVGDVKTGKWGYIDKQGHYAVNPQFDFAARFSEGLAAVRIGAAHWQMGLHRQARTIRGENPQFDSYAGPFSEGLAPMRIGDDQYWQVGLHRQARTLSW